MGKYEIIFYQKDNGRIPVQEFLDGLPKDQQTKGVRDINILEERGPELRPPSSKHIKEGIFELRIQASGNNLRVFYFFFHGNQIVLTNGFLKKTQKTPPRELRRALRYKRDWEKRMQNADIR